MLNSEALSTTGSDAEDLQPRVWPSIADIALCLALVMILYVVVQFVMSYEATALTLEIRDRQERLRTEIFAAVPPAWRDVIAIVEDGDLQRITFADQVLFESGDAALKDSGRLVLGLVGAVLARRSASFDRLQVEGHTDDRPPRFGALFKSNWELSSARATSVVGFLQQDCKIEPSLLSATGYAEYHPVDVGDDDAARAKNRRVELVVVYSPQTILEQSVAVEEPRS